jgi:DNA repair ATPase RecN
MATTDREKLSASVKVLLETIVSREFMDNFRTMKLDVSLLQRLNTTLSSLQAILNESEEQQFTNQHVKECLDNLSNAIFEVGNSFDEIKVEAKTVTPTSQVLKNLSSKLQKLIERLEWLSSLAE